MLNNPVTQLRETVVRSLVLAVRARKQGHVDLSNELIAHAAECEQKARAAVEAKYTKQKG